MCSKRYESLHDSIISKLKVATNALAPLTLGPGQPKEPRLTPFQAPIRVSQTPGSSFVSPDVAVIRKYSNSRPFEEFADGEIVVLAISHMSL